MGIIKCLHFDKSCKANSSSLQLQKKTSYIRMFYVCIFHILFLYFLIFCHVWADSYSFCPQTEDLPFILITLFGQKLTIIFILTSHSHWEPFSHGLGVWRRFSQSFCKHISETCMKGFSILEWYIIMIILIMIWYDMIRNFTAYYLSETVLR